MTGISGHVLRLKPGFLLAAGLSVWLAWKIVANGMSGWALEAPPRPAQALDWMKSNAEANLDMGLDTYQRDPGTALGYLRRAVRSNPADGRGYVLIGLIEESARHFAKAGEMMSLASLMAPQRADVQLQVGAFWARRGDYPRVLRHLDITLRNRPQLWQDLFPEVLKVAGVTEYHPALAKLLEHPVPWWSHFIVFASGKSPDINSLRRLYYLPLGNNLLSEEAFSAYLERLKREGLWTEAWFVWLSHLSQEEQKETGNIYNGSFERPISNLGFGWRYRNDPAVFLETATTFGATGERALHLVFRGGRSHFKNLSQQLLLLPGRYYLHGRVRSEGLEAAQGMRWALYCGDGEKELAHTGPFKGTRPWSRFRVSFDVDKDCQVQLLRLEMAGRIELDYDVVGSIWFDDIGIERTNSALESWAGT